MRLRIEVEESNVVVAKAEREVSVNERVSDALAVVAAELDSEREALLKEIGVRDDEAELTKFFSEGAGKEHSVRVRRVCIDLHFESVSAMRRFLSNETWADVHKWGCRHFHVAVDACANLELRDGSPTGPALNDRTKIGPFSGCKTVWMVKPGPEPNGEEMWDSVRI
ncbi:MAG TPA: hypothetical protein VK738_15535 [Terriglobales bacterium]|jgi:hypothetical protein|nr:hypothetical protein [Terriglobales bacterium]